MAVSAKHTFVSAKADGPDATEVRPSNWNADHTVNLTGPALVGSSTTGDTTATEVTVGAGLSLATNTLTNSDRGSTAVTAHEAAGDPHPQYLTTAEANALYAPIGGGSGFTPTIDKLTATQQSTATALANITQLVEAMVANATYEVEAFVIFQSAATTTGLNLGFTSPAGSTNLLEITVPVTTTAAATQLRKIFPNAGESVSGSVLGTGVTATASNHTAHVMGFIHTGATAGNFQLQFASEVAGSAVTLQIGSTLVMKRLV